MVDPNGLDVFGFSFGGSWFSKIGGGASSALLFESDGKTNKFGYVSTKESGVGQGGGFFNNIVYSEKGTIEGYKNTFISNSGSVGWGSFSWSYGADKVIYYEAGISPIPGESASISHPIADVVFSVEYSFGAADTFWGSFIYKLLHQSQIGPYNNNCPN